MRIVFRIALTALAFTAGAASASEPPGGVPLPEPKCQRACLEGYMEKYLQAMADNIVDPALFARDAKFTENGVQLPLGNEGLWATASGVGNYKFYIPHIE